MNTSQLPVSCFIVIPNCDTCFADVSVTWIICWTCQLGYMLINATLCAACDQNMPNCTTCTSLTYCTGCDATYYVQLGNSRCASCSIIPECYTCNSASQCTACLTEQYFVSTDYLCHLCSEGIPFCLNCTINVLTPLYLCTACESATYVNNAGGCQSCSVPMPGCLNCTNGTVCLIC